MLSMRIEPACGAYMPAINFKTVDLPDPLPPTTHITSPGSSSKLTPTSAGSASGA